MMKLVAALGVVVSSVLAVTAAQSVAERSAGSSASFKAFLTEFEKATTGFVNGDATLWKQNASRGDDVTLMGGWGTYEKGWAKVGARYDWAAARFVPSAAAVTVEYVSVGASDDLGYTVTIERSVAQVEGQAAAAPMALRVTQLFRREEGQWRLIHRHADPLLGTTSAESVLQKK